MIERVDRMQERARVKAIVQEQFQLERARLATTIEHAVQEARARGLSPLATLELLARKVEQP